METTLTQINSGQAQVNDVVIFQNAKNNNITMVIEKIDRFGLITWTRTSEGHHLSKFVSVIENGNLTMLNQRKNAKYTAKVFRKIA